jgi:hypothetical protein
MQKFYTLFHCTSMFKVPVILDVDRIDCGDQFDSREHIKLNTSV